MLSETEMKEMEETISTVIDLKALDDAFSDVKREMDEENYGSYLHFHIAQRVLTGLTNEHIYNIVVCPKEEKEARVKFFKKGIEAWREVTSERIEDMVKKFTYFVDIEKDEAIILVDDFIQKEEGFLSTFLDWITKALLLLNKGEF